MYFIRVNHPRFDQLFSLHYGYATCTCHVRVEVARSQVEHTVAEIVYLLRTNDGLIPCDGFL